MLSGENKMERMRDPGLLWSQSIVSNLCFQKRQPFLFPHNLKRKSIRYSIIWLQVASLSTATAGWVNFVAKSNKFPFPMILVWDLKQVNVARYSAEDHLIGWWVGCRTHFVSGRKMVGCPRECQRSIGRGLLTHFWGVRPPSGVSGPRRTRRPME